MYESSCKSDKLNLNLYLACQICLKNSQIKLLSLQLARRCIAELCRNNERVEEIIVVMLKNVSTDRPTEKIKMWK